MKILLKNEEYAFVEFPPAPSFGIVRRFVYANAQDLENGDKAELFGGMVACDFFPFMEAVLAQEWFTRECYGVEFGYQPADFDDDEVQEDDVRLSFLDYQTIITKKVFYELCIFACDARLIAFSHTEAEKKGILLFKQQLQEKVIST